MILPTAAMTSDENILTVKHCTHTAVTAKYHVTSRFLWSPTPWITDIRRKARKSVYEAISRMNLEHAVNY